MLFEKRVEIREALRHPLLKQRKKDIFLALEVRVEGAAGVTGERGDVFQTRGFESLPRENPFRGGEKPSARCFGAGLLPRGGRLRSSRPKRRTGRTERVVPDDQARSVPLQHTYMHVHLFQPVVNSKNNLRWRPH